eukprot:scaffold221_cov351-Pavlova_lutheri.AAC.27
MAWADPSSSLAVDSTAQFRRLPGTPRPRTLHGTCFQLPGLSTRFCWRPSARGCSAGAHHQFPSLGDGTPSSHDAFILIASIIEGTGVETPFMTSEGSVPD